MPDIGLSPQCAGPLGKRKTCSTSPATIQVAPKTWRNEVVDELLREADVGPNPGHLASLSIFLPKLGRDWPLRAQCVWQASSTALADAWSHLGQHRRPIVGQCSTNAWGRHLSRLAKVWSTSARICATSETFGRSPPSWGQIRPNSTFGPNRRHAEFSVCLEPPARQERCSRRPSLALVRRSGAGMEHRSCTPRPFHRMLFN